MGLAFDRGLIFASTATNATVVALNATSGEIKWNYLRIRFGYRHDKVEI
jgi:outer membrane protein assembly factor BamB